jgi:hypothetical protein
MHTARNLLLGAGATTLAAAAIFAAPTGAKPSPIAHAAACVRATNVEAIIDDSGSMSITDPNTLRVRGLELLINSFTPGTFLGAVEFGSAGVDINGNPTPGADTVFKPEPVGPNGATMKTTLEQKIQADNGATDYNAAFAQSDADNPNAQARIFLTDGGHNAGDYTNGHLTHKVPTYVIGFSPGLASPTDQARLQQIATDTGGHFYPLADASSIQSVINDIGAAVTCQTPPQQFSDTLASGKSKAHSVSIGANTKTLSIALTWANPADKFTLTGLKLVSHGKVVAVGARKRKPKKLKVTTTTSSTFSLVKVSRLKAGKLKFKVKASTIGSGQPTVTLTTQVSQSSHK